MGCWAQAFCFWAQRLIQWPAAAVAAAAQDLCTCMLLLDFVSHVCHEACSKGFFSAPTQKPCLPL
jgi:hypothetical protein